MKNLTKELALKLHRQMWSDMQRDLGNCPSRSDRVIYKSQWCIEHGFDDLYNYCFLCEYVAGVCEYCPIVWPEEDCKGRSKNNYGNWLMMPISRLLALPERSYD